MAILLINKRRRLKDISIESLFVLVVAVLLSGGSGGGGGGAAASSHKSKFAPAIVSVGVVSAWSPPPPPLRTRSFISTSTSSSSSSSALNLVPLSSFTDPSHKTFLSSSDSYRLCIDSNGHLRQDDNIDEYAKYTISIAEEDDLPQIASFVIDAFGGADVITLSNDFQSNLNAVEKTFIKPGINLWNNYANAVAFTDVLSGLRQRIMHRMEVGGGEGGNDNDKDNLDYMIEVPKALVGGEYSLGDIDDIAAKSSVIFVLAREKLDGDGDNANANNEIEIIASVELRLQPTDAKIPFSQPWFDKIERKFALLLGGGRTNINISDTSDTADTADTADTVDTADTTTSTPSTPSPKVLQPYLSNLCVDNNVRGRGIGKVLCRIIESTVRDSWKYNHIYLHVDLDNLPALNLYKKEGYVDVGARWNPFWAGSSSEIGYFVKSL